MPPLTGSGLRAVQLRRPGWGRRGSDVEQVDAFLARAADALDAVESTLRGGPGAGAVPKLNGRPLTG
jgi:DivIVA domain-containing protein